MSESARVFAENIARYRKRAELSQAQLAQKLSYSEKAVSKWECGRSLPNADTLPQLAKALSVTIDELFMEETEDIFYLGIDGGGTKTAFLLTDDTGKVNRTAMLGSSNPVDVGMNETRRVLEEGIRKITDGIPLCRIAMFAGIAGGITGDHQTIINEFLKKFGFYAFRNGSDGENAISAALDTSDGICIIVGTGSCAFYQQNKEWRRIGGLGYLFDRAGSGYDIGCECIHSAIMAEQGVEPPTFLTDMLCRTMHTVTVSENQKKFYDMGKRGVSALATLVFEAASGDDEVAIEIIKRNMKHVARLIEACGRKMNVLDPITVKLCGGIATHNDIIPYITEELQYPQRYALSVSDKGNELGAVGLARRLLSD